MAQNRAIIALRSELEELLRRFQRTSEPNAELAKEFDGILAKYEGVICQHCLIDTPMEYEGRLRDAYSVRISDRGESKYLAASPSKTNCACPPDSAIVENPFGGFRLRT